MSEATTVGEALRRHYAAAGLPRDGGRGRSEWTLALGPVAVALANFEWRRRALPFHDVHHVLTGYPCTLAGELEMAAWEFAAGRFPSPFATLFCLPLVGFGALALPRRSFRAFVRGRRSRTLYAALRIDDVVSLPLAEARREFLPAKQPQAGWRDIAGYLALAGASLAPFVALLVVSALLSMRHV